MKATSFQGASKRNVSAEGRSSAVTRGGADKNISPQTRLPGEGAALALPLRLKYS
jgi:hypothetical protein